MKEKKFKTQKKLIKHKTRICSEAKVLLNQQNNKKHTPQKTNKKRKSINVTRDSKKTQL